MPQLVALDLPGGPAFVAAVRRAWDAGDAVLPLDQRLPPAARADLVARAGAHRVLTTEGEAPARPNAPPVAVGDALVVATSGSTGHPKLVVHTAEGLAAHARAVHARLAVDPGTDRWLACLPLNHLGGFGVVARALVTGTPVDAVAGFDAEVVAAAPGRWGTTLVSLVPTALDRLDASPFRWVVLGGAADPVARPANVVRTYGMTETGGGVVYDGKPLEGVEVRVAGDGEILLRGPSLARGRRAEDGTVVPVVDASGWLATGDLGRWEAGRLVVAGRRDHLIVTGGENVWPDPVAAVLRAHPGVADAAVVGEDDPTWGQRVVAVVVPVDPSAPPTLDELRSLVRDRLGAPSAPRRLQLVDRIARSALGKVLGAPTPGGAPEA